MAGISILGGDRNKLSLNRKLLLGNFTALMCLMFFAVTAFGQTGTSSLSGVVSDQQGKAVVGANVTLMNVGTNASRTAQTTESGVFLFDLLPPENIASKLKRPAFGKPWSKARRRLSERPQR